MEQRQHYRAQLGQGSGLQVNILKEGATPIVGEALDVSIGGTRVQASSPDGPVLVMGDDVQLTFTSDQLEQPLVVPARTVHRAEEDGTRTYGFQFTDRTLLENQLAGDIYRIFNRRGSYRVQPPDELPIEVTLETDGENKRLRGRMVDISPRGMGVLAPVEAASAFLGIDRIMVSFTLPTSPDPVRLEDIIRSRRLTATGVRYGIALDFQASAQPEAQQNTIIDYVVQRQRDRFRRAMAAA